MSILKKLFSLFSASAPEASPKDVLLFAKNKRLTGWCLREDYREEFGPPHQVLPEMSVDWRVHMVGAKRMPPPAN